MKNPLISFIIPVYNREEDILKNINDLLDSNFSDYELILVDNASNDCSGKICEELALKYPQVISFHIKENQGPGPARNKGMDLSTGKFLFFWDSDDKINAPLLPKIADSLKANPDIDILTMNHTDITSEGNHTVKIIDTEKNYATDELLVEKPAILHSGFWRSFFNRNFLIDNQLVFYKIRSNEDLCFNSLAFLHSKKVYTLPDSFYRYYRFFSKNSIVDNSKYEQKVEGLEFCAEKLAEYCDSHNISAVKKYAVDSFIYASTMLLLESAPLQDLNDHGNYEGSKFLIDFELFKKLGMHDCVCFAWNVIWNQTKSLSLNFKKKVFLCPAGTVSISIANKILSSGGKIAGFLDNCCTAGNFHINKTQDTFRNMIYSFDHCEKYNKEDIFIVVMGSVNTARSISNQLLQMGFENKKHFICGLGVGVE